VLVTLAPAFEPMAMACAGRPEAMHCTRHVASAQAAEPAMPCHHGLAHGATPQPASSQAVLRADGTCCQQHCCCGATTSEWARPTSGLLSLFSILIERARPARSSRIQSNEFFGQDSARAPPRS